MIELYYDACYCSCAHLAVISNIISIKIIDLSVAVVASVTLLL